MANGASPRSGSSASSLLLKVTPPRVPRDLLVRQRLAAEEPDLRDRPAILVQAPAGFGKTALFAQWRREHLARGTVVAWVSAQEGDDTHNFVQALALAVRNGSGRPTFGHTLLEGGASLDLEGVTTWLAEVAQSALDISLFIDEAERLPDAARAALSYLVHNAPSNLRVLIASRPERDFELADLIDYGQCAVVGAAQLRFRLDETLALASSRLGNRIDADAGARLHEMTEGWPLGLQLALSAVARSEDPRGAIAAMAGRAGELHDRFVEALLANLDRDDAEFLTRIAMLDDLHGDLCCAMTGLPDAGERLTRLARDTPLFVAAENSEWLHMHAVARDALRQRFTRLSADTRAELQRRAAEWLARKGEFEQAARFAYAAGQREVAYDLAERCLYDSILKLGHVGAVIEWLTRLPAEELDRRPRLLLAIAWALSATERHAEAESLVGRILPHAGDDAELRCECALICGGAAAYGDNLDRFAELHDPWAESPPLHDLVLLFSHANRRALRALFEGDPAQARRHQQQAPRGEFGKGYTYVARWGELIVALSYLCEGQVLLTENLLRPVLASAEGEHGRRNPFVCMLAALLAAAAWEGDRPHEVAALLANRLDVLERTGLPDGVLLGFRAAARMAAAEGAEPRALELLEGLHAVGVSRNIPRLCVASLADQVRLHARRFRAETCHALCQRLDTFMASDAAPKGRLWRQATEWMQHLAHANAAIAAQEWRRALEPLAQVAAMADRLHFGRVRVEVMALRAFALDRCGEKSVVLLREAMDLADSYGLVRLFKDAHPALGDWVERVRAEPAGGREPLRLVPRALPPQAAPALRNAASPRANPSQALTPKEREVLELLARNLSNKEIALAMQIGEETIKWHLKNLFGKLAAGTRKQVVRRAQLLGLLEAAA